MSRHHLPVILALGALGCGPSEPQIAIDIHMSSLIGMGATKAVVSLYPAMPPTSCEVLRLSERGAEPTHGIAKTTVTLEGTGPQETEFFDLVPGDYQVAVFVYAGSTLIGFGCLANAVKIEMGKRTEAPPIEVRAVPK